MINYATLGIAAALLSSLASAASACDVARPVVFAGLDWDSAGFHNAVARFILENGFDCRTDVIPGTTIPLLQGVAQGDIDVAMEVWTDAAAEVWRRALRRRQVIEVGVNFPDAVQGWYVPRYVVAGEGGGEPLAPGLVSVADLPRYTSVFRDPEQPGKGRFYNCAAGWACEVTNTAKLRAYGLDESYTNFLPGTGAALAAAVTGAILRREAILFYYWSPTWLTGAHDLVRLEEPPWNAEDWAGLASDPKYPRAVAYPEVEVRIGVNARFAAEAPGIVAFLARYRTSAAIVGAALAYIQSNNVNEAAAANWFFGTYPEIWRSWLDGPTADRIATALKSP
jgi:ABC-type proline/glycine betaine transport system substrate-binding protein